MKGGKKRKRVRTIQDLPQHRERARRSSGSVVECRKIIMLQNSESSISEPLIKPPAESPDLDQALENAATRGDFDRVRRLVEEKGVKPADRHIKAAEVMKEKEIVDYLKSKIQKTVDERWDDLL